MQIVIQPYQSDLRPGRKAIMVDGVRWGVIEMDRHGVHGASYWFRQEGDGAIYEACTNYSGEPASRMVKIWGDKAHRHENGVKPLPERLAETVESLIDRQLLRHPDLVRALSAEEHRKEREERKKAEKAEQEEFERHAIVALQTIRNGANDPVQIIVTAMRWAQTQ